MRITRYGIKTPYGPVLAMKEDFKAAGVKLDGLAMAESLETHILLDFAEYYASERSKEEIEFLRKWWLL